MCELTQKNRPCTYVDKDGQEIVLQLPWCLASTVNAAICALIIVALPFLQCVGRIPTTAFSQLLRPPQRRMTDVKISRYQGRPSAMRNCRKLAIMENIKTAPSELGTTTIIAWGNRHHLP